MKFKVEFGRYFYNIGCAQDFPPFFTLLQLFLGERFIAIEQIAMLNLSSAFESVVAKQGHIYTNTQGKDEPNLQML